MKHLKSRLLLAAAAGMLALTGFTSPTRAADHGDAPTVAHDQGADIADVFAFLDPNDNTRVVIAGTIRGFIAAGENANFGIFDPVLKYRFLIENTGDAKPDAFIEVTFDKKTASATPQNATIKLPNGKTFTAPATAASLAPTAPAFTVTTNAENSAQFFAGMVDDPFFFDIPAFNRFIASVAANAPDASQFNRGRDSFAGYNVMAIAISLPVASLKNAKTPVDTIGVELHTQRGNQSITPTGDYKRGGGFKTIDRMGLPAINVALIPYARKNSYNVSKPEDDAKAKFADDIVATLKFLGTNDTNIGVLAGLAVTNGDYVRVNTTIANTGPQGGNNPEAGFPNGRRLNDDTIDVILSVVANGAALKDNVNDNGGGTTSTFPFFALPNQPREPGVIDDATRN